MKSILRKTMAYFLTFAMLAALVPFSAMPAFAAELSGTGTEADPILIETLAELEALRDSVNGGESYEGKYIKLTADIDMSEKYGADINGQKVNWAAIGDYVSGKTFKGSFDGDNHKITGMYINGGGNTALFSYIGKSGTVKNLTVSGEVTESSVSAIVAAVNEGTIKNVSASGSVSGGQHVGGICGMSYGTIESCFNEVTVTAEAETGGGICSYNSGIVKNCYNTGSVSGRRCVGGICGYNRNSYNRTAIQSCYNAAPVTAESETAGGICGMNDASVNNCYNVGIVTATNNNAGGICGSTVGGLSSCYNYASIISNGKKAGICAAIYPPFPPENCYYNGDAFDGTNYNYDGGGGDPVYDGKLSESEFADQNKFSGFDFGNTWVMNAKAGRPMLKGMEEADGSEYNPVKIRSLADLEEFRDSVNGGNNYTDKKILLLADIDMSEKYCEGKESWTPIGNNSIFSGTFDGGGHTISGLYISDKYKGDKGLFGHLGSGGTVKKLTVAGYVTSGGQTIGLVVSYSAGTVENVHADGYVEGQSQVGLVVGQNAGNISRCTADGEFSGNSDATSAGGVCGLNNQIGKIEYCRNAALYVITPKNGNKTTGAGICGKNVGTISYCYNTAELSGKNTAGICEDNFGTISNCYNIAALSAENTVSGICDYNAGTIENCYQYGTLTGKTVFPILSLEYNNSTVKNSYYNSEAFSGEYAGTAISAAEFADSTKFVNWDFTDIWRMNPLLGRPVLRLNTEGESGTQSDPYMIDSLEKFEKFRDSVNNGTTFEGEFVKLAADIDLSEKYNANNQWTPIGTREKPFSGTFDGNGHKISGLYINDTSKTYQGLFGSVSGGTIKKLAVTDAQVAADQYFAGIAAELIGNGTIENCYYIGVLGILNDDYFGNRYAGGIVCDVRNSTVKNCYANVTYNDYSLRQYYSGVIAGSVTSATIISCYFLESDGRDAVGGSTSDSTVENVSAKTLAQLAEQSTYIDWDFENVWTMHPILKLPTFAGGGFSGTGTEQNPYIITTLEELEILASAVNNGHNFEKTYFALGSDLDMGGKYSAETGRSWTPIGSSNHNAFSGVFDGRNHKITGLYIKDRADKYTGLFGCLLYNDFWKEDETFRAAIKNLTVSGSITGSNGYTGGIVGSGENGAMLENCGAEVDITSDSYVYNVGGLAGCNYGTITNSFASGNISAEGTVGGLVGYNYSGTIQNCYSLGSVTGNSGVGGLVGYSEGGTAVNSYSLSAVNGGKPLFGNNWCTVKNCYYTGNTADTFSESVRKTKAQFESGEVAYLLSQGCTISDDYWGDTKYDGSVWTQTIGKDHSPNFTGLAVSATTGCVTYNNSGDTSKKEHSIGEDGTCTACGIYTGATLVDGVYQIENEKDFIWFAELVNSGETAANAILKNDISLNTNALAVDGSLDISDKDALEIFTPMGNADAPYSGTFDGNGKTVSGIYIDDSELSYAGIFGVTGEKAVIKNLTVKRTYVKARKFVGIIAGQNNGTIQFCEVYGDVSGVYSKYDGGIVGGICGENNGTIEGRDEYYPTTFSGNVTMQYEEYSSGDYLGGIAGSNMGTIRYALNSGKIGVGANRRYVGGICGVNGRFSGGLEATVENCTNIGNIGGAMYAGGICGTTYKDAKVKSCTNGTGESAKDEEATIDADNYAGGICGENFGDVLQCTNHMSAKINVDQTDTESLAGGIVGENLGSISDCINRTVNVIGSRVGGICGRNDVLDTYKGTMQYCLSMYGSVLGTCAEGADAPVNCYYYYSDGSEKYDYGEAATSDDIGYGYLTYHLQNGREEQIWGQEINKDTMPILTSNKNKRVFKVSFTSASGNTTESYYTYYSTLYPPTAQGWWTENGRLIASNTSVVSDMNLKEAFYFITASGSNLAVYAQKGTYALITASYDENGKLIRAKSLELTFDKTGEQYYSSTLSGATVKAFLWDSVESMTPMCDPATVN